MALDKYDDEFLDDLGRSPKQPGTMLTLEFKQEKITAALKKLKIVPIHVNLPRYNVYFDVNCAKSIATYILRCHTLYKQQKVPSVTHRDFIICVISICYSSAINNLQTISTSNNSEGITARREYMVIMKEIGEYTHEKFRKLGNRALRLAQLFDNLSGLAILCAFGISNIIRLSNTRFNGFLAHIKDQMTRNTSIIVAIRGTSIDKRLLAMHGKTFPEKVHKLVFPDDRGSSYVINKKRLFY